MFVIFHSFSLALCLRHCSYVFVLSTHTHTRGEEKRMVGVQWLWCYRSSACQSMSIFNVVCGNVCTLRHENRWKVVNIFNGEKDEVRKRAAKSTPLWLCWLTRFHFVFIGLKMALFATNRTACANQFQFSAAKLHISTSISLCFSLSCALLHHTLHSRCKRLRAKTVVWQLKPQNPVNRFTTIKTRAQSNRFG